MPKHIVVDKVGNTTLKDMDMPVAGQEDLEIEIVASGSKRKRNEPTFLHQLTEEKGTEYESNMLAFNAAAVSRNTAGQARVETTVQKGALVSLESAVVIYNDFCAGKGDPLPADDPRQSDFWKSQSGSSSKKKILVVVNDVIETLPIVNNMK